MKRRAAFAGLFVVLAACGSARRGGPAGPEVKVDTDRELLGQKVFDANCHRCHPNGEAGLAPAINNKPIPAEVIRYQIRNGLGAMPGFDEKMITERELDAVVEYVFTLRRGD